MNEFLSSLLQAVIIAAVPVLSVFLAKGVQTAAQYLASKTENETAKKYLSDAAEAVTTAVTYTNQVYVDTLKKSGTFTAENQTEALNMAVDKAVSLLTEEAMNFLGEAYGDLTAYLAANIEAEVHRQKQTMILSPVWEASATAEATVETAE